MANGIFGKMRKRGDQIDEAVDKATKLMPDDDDTGEDDGTVVRSSVKPKAKAAVKRRKIGWPYD